MKQHFSDEELMIILEQSIIYTCACPAQLCRAIESQRTLYKYQQNCLDMTETDKRVHKTIAETIEKTHAELEDCLDKVLRLEGWNLETLQMPEDLQKTLLCELDDSSENGNA